MTRLLGTDRLTDIQPFGRQAERLVDVVLRGVDPERLTDIIKKTFGTDRLTDIFPGIDIEFLLAEAAAKNPRERAFEIAFRAEAKKVQRFEKSLIAETSKAIREHQRDVLNLINPEGLTEWGTYRLDAVKRSLKDAEAQLNARLSGLWRDSATQGAALALQSVDGPISKILGDMLGGGPLPAVGFSSDVLALMINYTPDLIVGINAETIKKVQSVLTQRMLGGLSSTQAKARLGGLVGSLPRLAGRLEIPGNVFSGQMLRTENLMRTEMNRVYNTISTSRIDELSGKIPGLGKKWIHNPLASRRPRGRHAALDGKVIFPGNGEKFELAGYRVDGPYDPVLPAEEKINCHCRVRVAYSDEVAAEQERRGTVKVPRPSKKIPKKRKARRSD